MRIFIMALLCIGLCACGGSNDTTTHTTTPPANLNNDLAPAAALDTPPTDGKLPSDLVPPV